MREDCISIALGLPEFRVLNVIKEEHHIAVWVEKIDKAGRPSAACPVL
jgi:hypothetical protein